MAEAGTSRAKRLFLALWPDRQTRQRILLIQQQLAQRSELGSAKPVMPQNLHLTLHFIGSVTTPLVDELCATMDTIESAAFEIKVDHLGCFQKPGVLWLGLESVPAELTELERLTGQRVSQCLAGYQQKAFTPHITLFRKARHKQVTMDFEAVTWRAGSFVLVESNTRPEGVEYSVLREWMLTQ